MNGHAAVGMTGSALIVLAVFALLIWGDTKPEGQDATEESEQCLLGAEVMHFSGPRNMIPAIRVIRPTCVINDRAQMFMLWPID